jgi:uncharacterized membrane protein YjgN (DUF898 family)
LWRLILGDDKTVLFARRLGESARHNPAQPYNRSPLGADAVISNNSSVSKPVPIFPLGEPPAPPRKAQALAAPSAPAPNATIESSAIEFSGTGGEYFRIWIVNLLLILVTFGIYYPWAKVRKIKYFYNNTSIDGHALDFHAEPKKMLRGTLIVGVFFLLYSYAVDLSPVAGLVAVVAFMLIAPPLFRASMRFRLANTSWRGMRFRFAAKDVKEAYWCIVPALALFLLPGILVALFDDGGAKKSAGIAPSEVLMPVGLYLLVLAVALPYFFWRLKRYQHNHYAWGPLQSEYRSDVVQTYKVFGLTLLMVALIVAVFSAIAFLALPSGLSSTRSWFRNLGMLFGLLIPLLFVFFIVINILPRAYFTAKMQNLLWSRTGSRHFRFKSDLALGPFIWLQFKNYLLIAITFGLYWPFAVIATKRMQLEAVSLKTRVSLEELSSAALARENDAAGDMAADIFGFDVGI